MGPGTEMKIPTLSLAHTSYVAILDPAWGERIASPNAFASKLQ